MPDGAELSVYPLPYGLKDRDYEHYDQGDLSYNIEHTYGSLEESLTEKRELEYQSGRQYVVDEIERTKALKLGRFNLRPATTPPEAGLCIAIYGVAGVGKTTLAAQCALSELGKPVLVIDAEGGSRAIAHMQDVYIADVKTWKEVLEVSQEVVKTKPEFKTVILDNMSEFQQLNLKGITGGSVPQIQHYGQNTNEMLNFVRLWRDVSRDLGINVIFIAWESPEKDESTGAIKRDLGFTPSLAKQFPGIIDIVGYLTVDIRGTRILEFAPSPRNAAKFRRSQSEIAMQIPLKLYYTIDEHPMVDLLNTLKGGEKWPVGRYTQKQSSTNN